MKKTMKAMISALCAAAMLGSMSVTASADGFFVPMHLTATESANMLIEISRRNEEKSLYNASLEMLKTYGCALEDSLFCAIRMTALLCVHGDITAEEFDAYVADVAAGEKLPKEIKARINSDEITQFYSDMTMGDQPDVPEDSVITEENLEKWAEFNRLTDEKLTQYEIEWEEDGYNVHYFAFSVDDDDSASGISKKAVKDYLAAQFLPTGDLNASGEPDMIDAVLLSRAVSGTYELSVSARQEADLNGDGEITSADLTLLLQTLAGL